jgi:formate dehydrogenase major subunit
MRVNRRQFIKVTGAGAACLSLVQLELDLSPVQAYASSLKIEGAKEMYSICPFCSVSCHIISHVKDGKLISTEGDPDYPINQGALCAKGASMLSMTRNEHRLAKPLYRAPGATRWEEKSWDWTLEQIASRVKKVRDKDLILKNDKGQTVNRLESMFFIGTSHADNEECAIAHQLARSLGIVHLDHQART